MRKILATTFFLLCGSAALAAADVNKAQLSDLDGMKGIGPDTSRRILAEREKAPFKDWKDLMARVKGIGPAKAQRLSSDGLTVNGEAFKPAAAKK